MAKPPLLKYQVGAYIRVIEKSKRITAGCYCEYVAFINSSIFKRFLEHNRINDKPILKSYPHLQGKVEEYNQIVKNEFLAVEDISNKKDGKIKYDLFVKAYNDKREYGGL